MINIVIGTAVYVSVTVHLRFPEPCRTRFSLKIFLNFQFRKASQYGQVLAKAILVVK